MARLPKKFQKRKAKGKLHDVDPKEGVKSTVESWDYRLRDDNAVRGMKLDKSSRKKMDEARKMLRKKS